MLGMTGEIRQGLGSLCLAALFVLGALVAGTFSDLLRGVCLFGALLCGALGLGILAWDLIGDRD